MQHRGRAVVFEDIDDYKARIGDPDLDIDESCIMVLKNCGPRGYSGMAEVSNMGLPPKILARRIKDMVRISDARMSGTAYGTVVLHASPEAGPLAVHWRWCRHATSSSLMSKDADCTSMSMTRNSRAGESSGQPRNLRCKAGTKSSTSTTCSRPTRVLILIFWWDAGAPKCPAIHTRSRNTRELLARC